MSLGAPYRQDPGSQQPGSRVHGNFAAALEPTPALSPCSAGSPSGCRGAKCRQGPEAGTPAEATGAQRAYLLEQGVGRQPLQALQVGVEQRAVQQAGTQQPLHNVAHRAVVRQPNPLGCAHETAQAGERRGDRSAPPEPWAAPPAAASACLASTHLAHGLILSARPLLKQNPAPPVANQNLTVVT